MKLTIQEREGIIYIRFMTNTESYFKINSIPHITLFGYVSKRSECRFNYYLHIKSLSKNTSEENLVV